MDAHRVVAAIDFGTHGTGYAWAVVDSRSRDRTKREINDKDQWPGAKGQPYPKTLSAVLLHDGVVESWGHLAHQRYSELATSWNLADRQAHGRSPASWQVTERQRYQYLYGLKMSLRGRGDPAYGRTGVAIADNLTDPTPAIGAFLREIVQVALADITSKGHYRDSDIRWCLTVPAIWDQPALQRMRQAAAAAGLPADPARLLLIPEPDAAALYCDIAGSREARDNQAGSQARRRAGTRFLVVDCGGGTADLVSYEVGAAGSIEQFCRPSGGAFGAEYTTRDFLMVALSKRLGGEVDLDALQLVHAEPFAKMVADWERGRNTFTLDQDRPVLVDIPTRLANALSADHRRRLAASQPDQVDDMIVIAPGEMRALLDSVVNRILTAIDAQLAQWSRPPDPDRAGDCLYLVGGFAQSPYLQRRVIDHVGSRIKVLLTEHPERAVLFGAVHYCYDPASLRARVAKSTYGCLCSKIFQVGDKEEYVFYNEDNEKRTDNRFLRFVTVGEKVPVDREVQQDLVPQTDDQVDMRLDFYATSAPDARYVTDPGMEKIGYVTVSLSGTKHLPRAKRTVRVYMKFGEADIQVRAVNLTTGGEAMTNLNFNGGL